MNEAIEEARLGLEEGGIPIGSVLVRASKILGRGHNKRVQENNPVMHAEIDCLQNAGRLRSYHGTVLYSTLMPCYLCAGAVIQFGIKKVVVGESENFSGAGDLLRFHEVQAFDLNLDECKQLMQTFILKHPALWNEDIGKL